MAGGGRTCHLGVRGEVGPVPRREVEDGDQHLCSGVAAALRRRWGLVRGRACGVRLGQGGGQGVPRWAHGRRGQSRTSVRGRRRPPPRRARRARAPPPPRAARGATAGGGARRAEIVPRSCRDRAEIVPRSCRGHAEVVRGYSGARAVAPPGDMGRSRLQVAEAELHVERARRGGARGAPVRERLRDAVEVLLRAAEGAVALARRGDHLARGAGRVRVCVRACARADQARVQSSSAEDPRSWRRWWRRRGRAEWRWQWGVPAAEGCRRTGSRPRGCARCRPASACA